MTRLRARWTDLPASARARIGAPVSTASQSGGFSTGVAERLRFADGSRVFVKAMREDDPHGTVDLYRREAAVLRGLPRSAPAAHLIDAFSTDGWFVMLIEDVDGRHPERDATHPDTTRMLDAMLALSSRTADPALPALADDLAGTAHSWHRLEEADLVDTTTDWARAHLSWLQDSAALVSSAVTGDRLIHGDLRADNALITDDGHAVLLDWPWAGRGPVWVDALLYLLDLRVAHADAPIAPLLQHPVFASADAARIDAVLAAIAGSWFEVCRLPAPAGMTTLRDFQRLEAVRAVEWLAERHP